MARAVNHSGAGCWLADRRLTTVDDRYAPVQLTVSDSPYICLRAPGAGCELHKLLRSPKDAGIPFGRTTEKIWPS